MLVPRNTILDASVRATSDIVGRTQAVLGWYALLKFVTVSLAAMQGTLVFESAYPCRISYRKYFLLLVLEFLLVIAVIASEVSGFIDLSSQIYPLLPWLSWFPGCLLALGISELIIDVYFTLQLAVRSRMDWIPFSAIGRLRRGSRRLCLQGFEIGPLIITAGMSIVLLGWRQRWWLNAPAVSANDARTALNSTYALSTAASGFCIGWGLLSTSLVLFLACAEEVNVFRYGASLMHRLGRSSNPTAWFEENPDANAMFRDPSPQLVELYDKLYEVEHGIDALALLDEDDKIRSLQAAPLHIGNAIVGEDKAAVHDEDAAYGISSPLFHLLIMFAEHFAILPLLICIMVAVLDLWQQLDEQTFSALKDLVDFCLVVALVQIAVGIKTLMWSVGYTDKIHPNDRSYGDPST